MQIKSKNTLSGPSFSLENKLYRLVWGGVYLLFFKISPVPLFAYRRWILRLFGANIKPNARIYPSARIWLPSNLVVCECATIGPGVNIYNQGMITVGEGAIISQYAHLCASTHDYNDPNHPLELAPIVVEKDVWVCADAFIGPGAHIKEGGVVGARAVVSGKTEPWMVYAGNPARKISSRKWI